MYVIRLVAVAAYFQHSSTERPRAGLGYLNKSVRVPSPLLDSTLFPSLPPHSRDPKVDLLGNSLVAATACFHSSPNILEILDHEETMFIRQVCIKIFITCYTPILYVIRNSILSLLPSKQCVIISLSFVGINVVEGKNESE